MKLTAQDKKWRAESDAETLKRAQEIKDDRSRLNLALKAANELAKKANQEAGRYTKIKTNIKGKK